MKLFKNKAEEKDIERRWFKRPIRAFWRWCWHGSHLRKAWFIFVAILIFLTGAMYGLGQWYIWKHSKEPLQLGTTFISDYAESFQLNPQETLGAILGDLNIKHVRFVSYWNNIEPNQGSYDFSDLDWQMAMADKYHAKVSLAIGLRQPRWPECHQPAWVDQESKAIWEPQLNQFMAAVINRYKNNPALESYQLENEFFMKVFGTCKDFDRNRLISEYSMVKRLDPKHKVIISRSDNWIGLPVGKPTPDEFGISVYKRVWDSTFTHRYFEYPLPSWFYAALAGGGQILTGKDMIIHELQAEPWTPNGLTVAETPIKEQYKSMNATRMKNRIQYAENTGMKTIDLWGAEWWYWLKTTGNDPSVWNAVKQAVADADTHNQGLAQK